MRVFVLFVLFVSTCCAQPMTFGIAEDGTVMSWQPGVQVDPSKLLGAVTLIRGTLPEDLGPYRDELGVRRWKWDGATFVVRPADAIAADRYKALAPDRVKAFKAWKDATDLHSADPSAITTEEVDALRQKYEEERNKR